MTDTGETTSAMNARADIAVWPKVLNLLRSGAVLFRPSGMTDYYTWPAHPSAGYVEATCLTKTGVKNLASEGVLLSIGLDRYGLNPEWVEPAPIFEVESVDQQPDLFGAAA